MGTAIVWFRRDLRMSDNPALAAAAEAGGIVPVFCFEGGLYGGRHGSANRNAYLRASLRELDASLRDAGSKLHYRSGDPAVQIRRLAAECGADVVHVNRDHTAHARSRDRRVQEALDGDDVELAGHTGISCAEIAKIETGSGGPYRVFTPFSKAWMAADRRDVATKPRKLRTPTGIEVGEAALGGAARDHRRSEADRGGGGARRGGLPEADARGRRERGPLREGP